MSEPMPDLDSAVLDDVPPEEPTRTRKPRSDKGKPRGSRSGGPRNSTTKQIVDDLLVPYATLAAGFSMIAPTVSGVLMVRGEATVTAVVGLAAKNPRMLAALKKASVMGPVAEIAQTALMVGVAGAMDFGRIPPDHPLAAAMGVSEVYQMTHADMPPPNAMYPDMPANGPAHGFDAANAAAFNANVNGGGSTYPPVSDPSQQWTMPG